MEEQNSSAPRAFHVREATIAYGPRKRPALPRIGASTDVVCLEPIAALRSAVTERFLAVALDARNRPVAWATIGIGTSTSCPVSACDVLRFAILSGAPGLVIVHNHPSGDPAPSPEDIALTDRLRAAADLVGLRLLDHVIVAEDAHFSFLDAGLLARKVR